MARSINKVILVGNLTRDPELRYTPQGTAVCTFGMATNRRWKTESGDLKDEAEFHNLVAWQALAEICAKLLKKGAKVYVEGRLQTRDWTGQDGAKRTRTEIVISDMVLLESRGVTPGDFEGQGGGELDVPADLGGGEEKAEKKEEPKENKKPVKKAKEKAQTDESEDIPF
jgi:single-strand DNA-binding protein